MPLAWRILRAAKAYGRRSSRDSLRRRPSWPQAEPTVRHFQKHIVACSGSDSENCRKNGLSTLAVIFQHGWRVPSPDFSSEANASLSAPSSIGGFSIVTKPHLLAAHTYRIILT